MSVLAGVIVFTFSLPLTTVLFPNLIQEMKTVHTRILREADRNDAKISVALSLQTPLIQALQGLIGIVATGLVHP